MESGSMEQFPICPGLRDTQANQIGKPHGGGLKFECENDDLDDGRPAADCYQRRHWQSCSD